MGQPEAEERLHRFELMLRVAELEADRDGPVSIDNVLVEINEIIDAAERHQHR
jgi:hypothetical protein